MKVWKTMAVLSVCALVFLACPVDKDNDTSGDDGYQTSDPIPVTGVSLNKNTLTLDVGDDEALLATIAPADASDKELLFTSSNPTVATVTPTGGFVEAAGPGTTTITVKTNDGNFTATCDVTVENTPDIITIEMVLIPPALESLTFTMGSPLAEDGRHPTIDETEHSVTLTAKFRMSKHQVTQAQYIEVMGDNPSYYIDGVTKANHPVFGVTFYQAMVFCNKLSVMEGKTPVYQVPVTMTVTDLVPAFSGYTADTAEWGIPPITRDLRWDNARIAPTTPPPNGYRLPTEEQWEYACRAGTTTPFNWGEHDDADNWDPNAGKPDIFDSTNPDNYNDDGEWDPVEFWGPDAVYERPLKANYATNSTIDQRKTTAVGSYEENPWDLCDMHGNVREWCWSWLRRYEWTPDFPQQTPPVAERVTRGGYWKDGFASTRSASRTGLVPFTGENTTGFRLVLPE